MAIDVMLDLETTGIDAGCCILSIGAVSLDLRYEFYETVSWDDSKKAGFNDAPETLVWWQKQTTEARLEAFSGAATILDTLGKFADWLKMIKGVEGDIFIWGNGADSDLPILAHAYRKLGMKVPWEPYNGRCYRTLKNLPMVKHIKKEEFNGIKHNSLEDARNQAKHMLKILEFFRERKEFFYGQ